MAQFEGKERRMPKIEACLAEYGFATLEEARDFCLEKGINVEEIVKGVQPIAFENAVWAYTLGTAVALKKGITKAADAAEAIGIGLQAFCVPGSVAEQRNVGQGHGNLGAMLLREETDCFCFLAGHESFAAAEGAIGIAKTANKARKSPLRVILNGLGIGIRLGGIGGGDGKQRKGLGEVLFHTLPTVVLTAQSVGCEGAFPIDCFGKPLSGSSIILLHTIAIGIHFPNSVLPIIRSLIRIFHLQERVESL